MIVALRCFFAVAVGSALYAAQPRQVGAVHPTPDPIASEDRAAQIAQTQESPQKIRRVVYQPPRRGAPTRRVGGATRAPEDNVPLLVALAAEQGGTTIQEQPTFYWYLSAPIGTPTAFTIVDPREIDPLVKVQRKGPLDKGLWRFSLESLAKRLEPDVEYEWYVALILDPGHRSKDVVSSGTIMLVRPSATVEERVRAGSGLERARILADEGFWYDAFEALTTEIMSHPTDIELRALRADLLEQVTLPDVAEYDRQTGAPGLVPLVPQR